MYLMAGIIMETLIGTIVFGDTEVGGTILIGILIIITGVFMVVFTQTFITIVFGITTDITETTTMVEEQPTTTLTTEEIA